MSDDEVVKYVMEQHSSCWGVDENGEVLEYYLLRTPCNEYNDLAAKITLNVLVFQNWREHLANALEVVKNWRAE